MTNLCSLGVRAIFNAGAKGTEADGKDGDRLSQVASEKADSTRVCRPVLWGREKGK